jgi:hypothetical protein
MWGSDVSNGNILQLKLICLVFFDYVKTTIHGINAHSVSPHTYVTPYICVGMHPVENTKPTDTFLRN